MYLYEYNFFFYIPFGEGEKFISSLLKKKKMQISLKITCFDLLFDLFFVCSEETYSSSLFHTEPLYQFYHSTSPNHQADNQPNNNLGNRRLILCNFVSYSKSRFFVIYIYIFTAIFFWNYQFILQLLPMSGRSRKNAAPPWI